MMANNSKTKGVVEILTYEGGNDSIIIPRDNNGVLNGIPFVENGNLINKIEIPNTTLRVGRRRMAYALGGRLDKFDAVVRHMAWGKGGIDGLGKRIPVPETNTTFIGGPSNILETTTVKSSIPTGDEPAIIFHGSLAKNSTANGEIISQLGLILESGDFWAITTYPNGFTKNPNVTLIINWKVYFL